MPHIPHPSCPPYCRSRVLVFTAGLLLRLLKTGVYRLEQASLKVLLDAFTGGVGGGWVGGVDVSLTRGETGIWDAGCGVAERLSMLAPTGH